MVIQDNTIMRFDSITHLRANLLERHEKLFFAVHTSRAHKDSKRYWSKANQTLTITKKDGSKVFYEPIMGDHGLILRLSGRG